MSLDRRQSERSDAFLIVEFRPYKKIPDYSLGITSNFSQQGFSFETQALNLSRGDIFEFIFKHPRIDFSVASSGEVVWKREAYDKCVTGVKFKDINEENKNRIADLFAVCKHVQSDMYDKEYGASEIYKDGKEPETERGESQKEELRGKTPRLKKQGKKSLLFIPLIVVFSAVSIIALSAKFENIKQGFINIFLIAKQPFVDVDMALSRDIPVPEMPAGEQITNLKPDDAFTNNQVDEQPLSFAEDPQNNMLPVQDSEKSGQQQSVAPGNSESAGKDKSADIRETPTGTNAAEGRMYFIQVGAWKNIDNAKVTFTRLQKDYPETRIISKNDFRIVVIPNVMSREKSTFILNNIKKELNLKPILISEHHYRETLTNKDLNASDKYAGQVMASENQHKIIDGTNISNKNTMADKKEGFFKITRFVIAKGIQNREPDGIANTFSSITEKAYCFLEARDIIRDTDISFVWYFEEKEVAKVDLSLRQGNRWRTSSSKQLAGNRGDWKVELQDASGRAIDSIKFTVE